MRTVARCHPIADEDPMSHPKCARRMAGATLAAALLGAIPAHAQSSGATAAELLFDEGKALVERGDYAAACPKFIESHRIDPSGGTILHAADCHQSEGKLATAWTEYGEALSFAIRDNRKDREKVAREQSAALAPRLGKVRLTFAPGAREQQGLRISVDRAPLRAAAWDASLPLDRGAHTVELDAEGRRAVLAEVVVEDGATTTFEVSMLERASPAKGADGSGRASLSDTPATPALASDPGHGRRLLGLAIGGAGLVGLGLGAGFGARAMVLGDQSGSCTLGPNGDGCPQAAVDEQNSARSSAAVSTVSFVAGGALTALGAVLYLTASKARAASGRRPPRLAAVPAPSGAVFVLEGGL